MNSPSQPSLGKAWSVVLAGTGVNLALGVLYSWSVFAKALTDQLNWTKTESQFPYTMACVVFAIFMIIYLITNPTTAMSRLLVRTNISKNGIDKICTMATSRTFPVLSVRTGTRKYPRIMKTCETEKMMPIWLALAPRTVSKYTLK